MPWYNNFKPPRQLKRKVKEAFKQWVLCLPLFCRVASVLSMVLILSCICSFDRHALDLLEKMLTLDPSQVPCDKFEQFWFFLMIAVLFKWSGPCAANIIMIWFSFLNKFTPFISRGYQQKKHLMQSISGLIPYLVIRKGWWLFSIYGLVISFLVPFFRK
jgi:hypothetical protein